MKQLKYVTESEAVLVSSKMQKPLSKTTSANVSFIQVTTTDGVKLLQLCAFCDSV